MIYSLEGKITLKGEKLIVLEIKGVGFKVFLSQKALSKIPQKADNFKVFCYLNVKENALDLYGFPSQEELDSFETLLGLPSIGPKAALEISSLGSIEKIKEALEKEDEKVIKDIFSIGKKKAQTIIWELSRKIKTPSNEKLVSEDEAYQALVKLGFSRPKVKEALSRIPTDIQESEKRVREALKILKRV